MFPLPLFHPVAVALRGRLRYHQRLHLWGILWPSVGAPVLASQESPSPQGLGFNMGQVGGRQQLDEIYFVQKVKLGQGSFGSVWRAKHRQSGDTVAVKQMDKASMPKRGVTRHDIEREVKMMKTCNHANITKLFDTFEDSGSIYLALEYCDGGDFGDKVKELGPVITEKDTAEWMRQMCEALSHLHAKGICHRDIKPDNFMVAGDSELKLADFGLAIYVRPGDVLTDKCGTPAFMAPEQHLMPVHSHLHTSLLLCEPEDFVHQSATCRDRNYVSFMMGMTFAGFPALNPGERQIPFEVQQSPIVEGLGLLEHSQSNTEESMKQAMMLVAQILSSSKTVIVGSVRMGYGHHRIAYSALTWALELGGKPFLLDILSPDCVEAAIVRNMDKQYSRMSRIASNLGGVIDAMWGKMMLQGDANALRCCLALSQKIRGIMAAFPKDTPVISSHPIVGNMAIACGFKTVINLIFDNYPQYFVLVPGAINLARLGRLEKTLPRRFLIAVGGAGAQRAFLEQLLEGIAGLLREKRLSACKEIYLRLTEHSLGFYGSIRIYLNCGDHAHIADAITAKLQALGLEFHQVTSNEGTVALCKKEALDKLEEPADWKAVTLFRFDSHFAAFRCTDLVIRAVDVLVTKPSELAFFPVPKLHIRRVGAHEAHSAVRAQELGDGSVECREVSHAVAKLHQLIERGSPLFRLMNECIMKAAETNVYDGSKVACEFAFGDRKADAAASVKEKGTSISWYMIIFGGKHPFLNKRNELDQRLMIEGRLDFTDTSSVAAQGLGLFGLGETIQKFSETARNFCKRLVCVSQSSRLTASNALREPWLNSGRRSAESKRKPMENGTPTAGTPRNGTPRNGTPRNGTPRKGGGTPRNGEAGANATAIPKGGMPPRPSGFGYPQAEADEKAKELEKLQKRVNELEAREREQEQKKTEEDDKARNKAKSFRTQKTKVTEVGTPGTPMSDQSPTTLMPAPRLLVPGTKCRYEPSSSSKFSFIPATVQSFNDLDSCSVALWRSASSTSTIYFDTDGMLPRRGLAMGLFGLWLLLVGSSCVSAEVATATLPTLRSDLLRAQELVRRTGKARQAVSLQELLDALRSLDLIKPHVFNTSVAPDVATLRKDTLGEVESLELLAKRLVETLQVSVDEAERLKNQHVKRIREEAVMGDAALNASVKLHEEATEHARQARHEYDGAMRALTRVNRLDQIFTLEVESSEAPEEIHQRVHNGSLWASLMQLDDVPLATPGYQKDQVAKKSTPCEHEAPPGRTLGTADSMPVPVAAQHPLPPTGPPETSTTAASVVTTTQSTSTEAAESDPSPDMPRIFIPGTREPEMEKIHAPSTTVATSKTSHIPSPTFSTTTPPSTSVSTDHLEYVMDETLEALMTERHRLIKIILNINRDIVRADNRSAGLLKARLVAEDAAVQLRRADENHGKAVTLVERQLNATQQKMQSLRGQIRIFAAAVKRLSGCLDPEEKDKRQLFLQQLKEDAAACERRKIAEEEETLKGLADHALVMWNKVESSLSKLQALTDALWLQSIRHQPAG
eukprot:s945_g15.t1